MQLHDFGKIKVKPAHTKLKGGIALLQKKGHDVANTLAGEIMSAPSKANASKLVNPARVTANPRHGTKPYA